MKKIWMVYLMMTLVTLPSIFSIPPVNSELTEKPSDGSDDGWETIYVANEKNPAPSSTNTDLYIYRIDRKNMGGNHWIIRYWIYNVKSFTGSFTDRVWLSDDSSNLYKWFIYDINHWNEYMWRGINGPYKTRIFPAPYRGWFYITVRLDIHNDIHEANENNNEETVLKLFWW